jgi:hypothetical protein
MHAHKSVDTPFDVIKRVSKEGSGFGGPIDDAGGWDVVRAMIRDRLSNILDEYYATKGFQGAPITCTFDGVKDELLAQIDAHNAIPPFSTQRLCELLSYPKLEYESTYKLMNAISKLVNIRPNASGF